MPGETRTAAIETISTPTPDRSAFTPSQRLFLQEIDGLKAEFQGLNTAEEIQDKKNKIQEMIVDGEISMEDGMTQLLAMAGRAIEITTTKSLHDNQFVCANILVGAMPESLTGREKADQIKGIIAEMDSGEGKTLAIGAATIAAASITSITADTVDVFTTNDSLAKRDALLLGQAYDLCGFTTGVITEDHEQFIVRNNYGSLADYQQPSRLEEVEGPEGCPRQPIYTSCDIIYGQPKTFIFDEAWDNLTPFPEEMTQVHVTPDWQLERHRKAVAIIDEIDSALLDEGITPNRRSLNVPEIPYTQDVLQWAHTIASSLEAPVYDEKGELLKGDYAIDNTDMEDPSIHITEEGYNHLKEHFGLDDTMLFTSSSVATLEGTYNPQTKRIIGLLAQHVHTNPEIPIDESALAAHSTELHNYLRDAISVCAQKYVRQIDKKTGKETTELRYTLWQKGRDYLVERKDGRERIVLISKHVTQRKLPNSVIDGITQALEVKEGVPLSTPTIDLDSITIQSFLRDYAWVCGTSGTAKSDESMIHRIYNLDVEKVPPFKPSKLRVLPPEIYKKKATAYERIVDITKDLQKNGDDPILVLAGSVQEAQELAELLAKAFGRDVRSNTLLGENQPNTKIVSLLTAENADDTETEVIAKAGIPGSITVATFLAGRGTDIQADNLNIIAANIPDRERQLIQAMHRTARQGKDGIFRIVANYETCELVRAYGVDNVEKARRVSEFIRLLPGIGELARDENGNLVNNGRAIRKAYKKTYEDLGDRLEFSVHTDAITRRDREVFAAQRDAILKNPQEWIVNKAEYELDRVIDRDFSELAKHPSWEAGDEEAFEKELDRLMVYTPFLPGQSGVDPYLMAQELKNFLAEDGQKEGAEPPPLTSFPLDVLQEITRTYLHQKLQTTTLQYFDPSMEEGADEEIREYIKNGILNNTIDRARKTFVGVWPMHLSFLVKDFAATSFHQKPFYKISLDGQKNLESLLENTKKQLVVYLLINLVRQQVRIAHAQQPSQASS